MGQFPRQTPKSNSCFFPPSYSVESPKLGELSVKSWYSSISYPFNNQTKILKHITYELKCALILYNQLHVLDFLLDIFK